MAPAKDGDALAAASVSGRRRRGQRELATSWGVVFCFGSRRRERRTVPVDGDLVVPGGADRDATRSGADDGKEARKGPRLQGCCFLAPARPPGRRKHGTMDSGRSTHDKQQQQLEHTKQQQQARSASERVPWQTTQAAGGSRSRRAERHRGAGGAPAETRSTTRPSGSDEGQPSKGVGAFGPAVGLSVVAAVSMAGLLGGRVWAVACVCAWLAALSGLRHGRELATGAKRRRLFSWTPRITRSPSRDGGRDASTT